MKSLFCGSMFALMLMSKSAVAEDSQLKPARIGTNHVIIKVSGGSRLVDADGIPNHVTGDFPNAHNPNSISPQDYHFKVPVHPTEAATPIRSAGHWFGVALNGVPFEPGTGEFYNGQREWMYEAKSGFIDLGLDQNNAHVQPQGSYHYHGLPEGLIEKLGGDRKNMLLVGWAADGYPLYTSQAYSNPKDPNSALKKMKSGYRLKTGVRNGGPGGPYDGRFPTDYEFAKGAGDLDECNGRKGVTPEFPAGTFYYCLTEEFPYISRKFHGSPDPSFQKMGPGPGGGGPGSRRRPPGPPPF
jgi:hypothetical protein